MKRTVVVSGGGTGIGRAVARSFVLSGDAVVIVGRRPSVVRETAARLNAEAERAQTMGRAEPLPGDLEEPDQVAGLADAIRLQYGGVVDVLVNNAGGIDRRPARTLAEIADSWLRDFRSNVLTAVLLTEALSPVLRRPGGRIINMSSIAALRGGAGSYSAAKAALVGWTFDLAQSLGQEGVTANVVAPGYIAGTEFFGDTMTPERHQRLVARTLVGRAGTAEDVAATVHFLASEGASYITGQVVQVNGGALLGR